MNSKNKKKVITIKDIAKEAGVCIGTVSKFFNDRSVVSEKLSAQIQKVITKHNYRINVSASSLRGKITKMIGVIIPDSSSLHFSFVIKEIEKLANQFGYSVLICNSENNFNTELEYINVLKSRNIDGLIIIPSEENIRILERLDLEKTPVVLINRIIKNSNVDSINIDTYNILLEVIDYLVSLKHKKIAFIIRETHLIQSMERLRGYKDGLKKNKITINKEFIIDEQEVSLESGYKSMVKILNLDDKPTAVIVYNDTLAIGAIKAIKDYNFKVPDDFSIVGFDNSFVDGYLEPTLTSLDFPKEEIASKAFSLLLARMNGDKSLPKDIIVPSSLVIRNSTGENMKID